MQIETYYNIFPFTIARDETETDHMITASPLVNNGTNERHNGYRFEYLFETSLPVKFCEFVVAFTSHSQYKLAATSLKFSAGKDPAISGKDPLIDLVDHYGLEAVELAFTDTDDNDNSNIYIYINFKDNTFRIESETKEPARSFMIFLGKAGRDLVSTKTVYFSIFS